MPDSSQDVAPVVIREFKNNRSLEPLLITRSLVGLSSSNSEREREREREGEACSSGPQLQCSTELNPEPTSDFSPPP